MVSDEQHLDLRQSSVDDYEELEKKPLLDNARSYGAVAGFFLWNVCDLFDFVVRSGCHFLFDYIFLFKNKKESNTYTTSLQ